jgi:hypothetical protein
MIWRVKLLSVSTNFRCIEINIAVLGRPAPGVGAEENHHLRVQGRQRVPDPRLQLVRKLDRVRRHACIPSAAGIPRQGRFIERLEGSRTACPWGGREHPCVARPSLRPRSGQVLALLGSATTCSSPSRTRVRCPRHEEDQPQNLPGIVEDSLRMVVGVGRGGACFHTVQ